ncbi:hypothetical protein AB0L25_24700 [Spirillospora sp. NPDC052242]
MPSKDHELPLEMVRNQPDLVPELLRRVFHEDIPKIPEGDASLTAETYNAFHPQELRCDATVLVGDPEKPSLGIIVESQLREDPGKGFSWPAYVANFRLRHKCDTILLVFCPDEQVARACSNPIRMGHPNWDLKPLTLHPGKLAPITDPTQARKLPELVFLSTPAHVEGPHQEAVVTCYAEAMDEVARTRGSMSPRSMMTTQRHRSQPQPANSWRNTCRPPVTSGSRSSPSTTARKDARRGARRGSPRARPWAR